MKIKISLILLFIIILINKSFSTYRVGNFYTEAGKYLGTDEKKDAKIYIITNEQEIKLLKKTKKSKKKSIIKNLKSKILLPSYTSLKEALNVLKRTKKNGGIREESSIVMKDKKIIRGKTSEIPIRVYGYEFAFSSFPDLPKNKTPKDVELTIHSHPIEAQIIDSYLYAHTAYGISEADRQTFLQYDRNIIVGCLEKAEVIFKNAHINVTTKDVNIQPIEGYIINKNRGIVIYNSKGKKIIGLEKKAVKRILRKEKKLNPDIQ